MPFGSRAGAERLTYADPSRPPDARDTSRWPRDESGETISFLTVVVATPRSTLIVSFATAAGKESCRLQNMRCTAIGARVMLKTIINVNPPKISGGRATVKRLQASKLIERLLPILPHLPVTRADIDKNLLQMLNTVGM